MPRARPTPPPPARTAAGTLARNLRGTPRPDRYRTRWHIARAYHLLQLPFAARRMRVLADWTTAAMFRRDVAELSPVEPQRRHR